MHSAVLQNKKYVKFSKKSTVEVLALGRLDEAIKKEDRKAQTYKGKDANGKEVDFMVAWPNLTAEDIKTLRSSKAGTFNNTGKIPYTAIIDPHTEKEIGNGYRSAKSIMDGVEEARKVLVKAHGKGISRKAINKINAGVGSASTLVEQAEFAKAIAVIQKIESKKQQSWPESLVGRLEAAREDIVDAAKKELAEVESLVSEDAVKGKRALQKLIRRLKGTGLEQSARELLKSTSSK